MDPLVKFYRWSLRVRTEVTRARLAGARFGAENCSCDACRNFVAARELAYPADFREKIALLGIDYRRETEVYGIAPSEGLVMYGGWFNFVGSIESGRDAAGTSDGPTAFELQTISEHFSAGVTTRTAIVHAEAWGHPVLQLEFSAMVPWVIEPPVEDSFGSPR